MEKKICRVLITTQCNLSCKYCCNKLPEIQESFKMTTYDEFIKKAKEYTDINITGGEPLLCEEKLETLVDKLYIYSNAKLWLYTNGLMYPYRLNSYVRQLNGVNIGCHDNFEKIRHMVLLWKQNIPSENVKLHIQDIKCTSEIEEFCKKNDIGLKKWTMNQCDGTIEDRYII